MNILQFNVWTGRIKGAPERFLKSHHFDVICMQEAVWSDDCGDVLSHFATTVEQIKAAAGLEHDLRTPTYYFDAFGGRIEQGNVIISRYPIIESNVEHLLGSYKSINEVYENNGHDYPVQKVLLDNGIIVVNYHGYWQKDPLGNQTTVECMKKVADMIRDENRPVVMCGDLNIIAESPAMRELDFLRDLTAENNIKQTLQNIKFVRDVACDHILINQKLAANNFHVYDDILSDHKVISAEVETI